MTSQPNLIPREPRKLKQPSKSVLRDQLALAADAQIGARAMIADCAQALRETVAIEVERDALRVENAKLRAQVEQLRRPWWRRWLGP